MIVSSTPFDVVVVGEGVSGLSAAGALARTGLSVATLEAQLFGGLIINVNELDPVPAGKPSSGAELAAEMMQSNAELGVVSIQEAVSEVTVDAAGVHALTDSGRHSAHHLIVASGGRLKRLGIPGESDFEGRGVSQCADCDGPMFQNEDAIVVGGGDSAFQEARVLAQYCRRVHLIHRSDTFRASPRFVEHVLAHDKISVLRNATVEAVTGGKMVEAARVRHGDGRTEDIPCAGVFVYVGLEPNSAFLPSAVTRDAAGFVRTDQRLCTTIRRISAIGAVRSGFGGSLVHALEDSERAAEAVRTLIG